MTKTNQLHEFVEVMHHQHVHLHTSMCSILRMLTERRGPPGHLADRMLLFAQQVEEHFRGEEEPGGFFQQALSRDPRFAHRVNQLRTGHQGLRSEVGRLIEMAHVEPRDAAWWDRLEKECHRFSSDLSRHEFEETALIQEMYSDDIGVED